MFQSQTLDDLGRFYGTDKCSAEFGHDFLRKYEFFFKHLKDKRFAFLELGIYKGASLKMWADYFTAADIIGVDIEPQTLMHRTDRIKVIVGNLSEVDFLESLASLNPEVIIDDASHWWPDQLKALLVLYPGLKKGGLYVIEDIHTSFPPLDKLFKAGFETPPFYILQKLAEYLTGNYGPSPIVRDEELKPISPSNVFHEEICFLARHTEAVIFLERACLLIRK
ncbi:MAG: class I SAM-dependent methyltransferase [Deltaproteobacteria bacterium]|jgi:SAM-dependent methyltransferase|nr:class I SAM-dependent methyltransferase [Deltaproteobacteria bacterium]